MSIRIKELISGVEYRVIQGTTETVVMEIAYDSRKTKSGSMFVASKDIRQMGMIISKRLQGEVQLR